MSEMPQIPFNKDEEDVIKPRTYGASDCTTVADMLAAHGIWQQSGSENERKKLPEIKAR